MVAVKLEYRCAVQWSQLQGDGDVRFCGECKQQVHDLSALTEAEAQEFLARDTTSCVRFVQSAGEVVPRSRKGYRLLGLGAGLVAGGVATDSLHTASRSFARWRGSRSWASGWPPGSRTPSARSPWPPPPAARR